jgi:hypothetical protein
MARAAAAKGDDAEVELLQKLSEAERRRLLAMLTAV